MTDRSFDTKARPQLRSSRQSSRSRRRPKRAERAHWGVWVLAALVAVVLALVATDAVASTGRVHPGVTVAGVKVGGKAPNEVVSLLKATLPAKAAAAPVVVMHGDKHWTVKAKDIGASFDYAGLLDKAMAVGRQGGFLASVDERLRAWSSGVALSAPAQADPDRLSAEVSKIASALDVPAKDATLTISADDVTMKSAATGEAVDRTRLTSQILTAFTSSVRTVPARVATAQPRIDDAEAAKAQALVKKMLESPVTVTYGAKSWTLSTRQLAKMVVARAVQTSGTTDWVLDPEISPALASKAIVPMVGTSLGKPPVDAKFKTSAGVVTIVPSKEGVGPDIEDFSATLTSILKSDATDRSVALHTKVTQPKLTTAQARRMGITDRISTFTTEYDPGNGPRVSNIHLLGSALDGKLVPPGSVFSFNGYVGERTAAKGYVEAPAIVKGKLVPQLGGGICQVGTTMFNAVFFSGFPVLERINHSFYISHYPKGRDATVSWGGPDLKWKNTTSHWVLVSVSYSSDSITISLYGTDPGYDVSYETGPFTHTVDYTTQTVSDPKLAAGVKVVDDPGETGRTCVVSRTVKKGPTVVRTDSFKSVYQPKAEVVRVGTKGKASKPATTTPAQKG